MAVALGGVLGSESRYGLSLLLPHAPGTWPGATVLVNVTGSLLIGVLVVAVTERGRAHPLARPFLGVGVLGGYTTFSTFSTDVLDLLAAGRTGLALGYLVGIPLAALAAVTVGTVAARAWLPGRRR